MGGRFLTEDIVIAILLRLTSGSCIGRFRCICRSWRNLLSDPNFIRRILCFKNPNDEEALRILVTGTSRVKSSSSYEFHCSSRSYATLDPISGHELPSSSVLPRIQADRSSIKGCCDGIFCISTSSVSSNRGAPGFILWNPATSETKTLPPCAVRDYASIHLTDECTGFGFDPRTKDYKVIRVLHFFYPDRGPLAVAEVYSLRNDSWKRLTTGSYDHIFGCQLAQRIDDIDQQQDTSRNEKCYWFERDARMSLDLISSFDMTTEEFALDRVPRPPSRENWYLSWCFISKGVFMATFEDRNRSSEMWGLLKYGVAESWTKLLTVRPPGGEGIYRCLEMWKDGMYICVRHHWMPPPHRIFSFDPATGEIIYHHLEIEGTIRRFHAHTYLPTQASLSLAAD